jgi:CRP-like cAMP-binding protein
MKMVDGSKLEIFFQRYRLETYKKGHVLLLATERPDYAYYLLKGRVKQYDITRQGKEIIVHIIKPDTSFLILPNLTELPNSFYFSAATDITACRAPVKDALRFVTSNPDIMKDILVQTYLGFDKTLQRTAHFMSGNTKGRIIYEILADIRERGEIRPIHLHILTISETELAARTGLTRETVSREISQLKKSGVLAPMPKIVIPDILLLEQALEESF